MNERIQQLAQQAGFQPYITTHEEDLAMFEKFAELIVKECADAADMAYAARCAYPGDYVGEYMGYGREHGITAWRTE